MNGATQRLINFLEPVICRSIDQGKKGAELDRVINHVCHCNGTNDSIDFDVVLAHAKDFAIKRLEAARKSSVKAQRKLALTRTDPNVR